VVSRDDETILANLTRAFVNLGSNEAQAGTMASQLLKRARQLSTERGISEAEAMSGLLQKVIQGRRGEYTGENPGSDRPA